jgi:hypothetical protein
LSTNNGPAAVGGPALNAGPESPLQRFRLLQRLRLAGFFFAAGFLAAAAGFATRFTADFFAAAFFAGFTRFFAVALRPPALRRAARAASTSSRNSLACSSRSAAEIGSTSSMTNSYSSPRRC